MFAIEGEVVGWPSIESDEHAQNNDQNICERQCFLIQNFRESFHNF
jgi:hypothetical protein